MVSPNNSYLTTSEVAELLRLKERKVYDLASSGDIPCVRATGKLLFPRDLVEAWLARHTEFSGDLETLKHKPPICAGSHDPLLDWALRDSDCGIAVRFGGSLDGLRRLAKAEAVMAGSHLMAKGQDGKIVWNEAHLRRMLPGQPVVLIEWAWRDQGLIVAPGNPLQITGVKDLRRHRVIARQPDAGAFVLLEKLVGEAGFSIDQLKLPSKPARTESDVAAAVAEGAADAGIAIKAVARQYRLDFIPLLRERYDLIIWRRDYFEPPVQKLLTFCRTSAFQQRAKALDGYHVADTGRVAYNGP